MILNLIPDPFFDSGIVKTIVWYLDKYNDL